MHTALEMKGISTKTICTACYHLTIVVFCVTTQHPYRKLLVNKA